MKIVIFAPHPDDEIFGCGGTILKWINENHEVHLVYVTDNRVLITYGMRKNELLEEKAKEYMNLNENEIADIALNEAKIASKKFGFLESNVHYFKFYDQEAMNNIDNGIKLSKPIITNADRIVLPSDNNTHPDHQATHIMAKQAARDLRLKDVEFYVYNIRGVLRIPQNKQLKINMVEHRSKILDILKEYKTQLCFKETALGMEFLKRRRTERFGIFSFEDMDKFENF
ncbi:MAG: PIG-L deacetylase family protein [Promethearchaeota archaeon]|jgi:LmbE family N-acetylglucosaminyl deacetylase